MGSGVALIGPVCAGNLLARATVYTDGLDPDEIADLIVAAL